MHVKWAADRDRSAARLSAGCWIRPPLRRRVVPQNPGYKDKLARVGKMPFDFGMLWFKGQSLSTEH
jgi:hypothetical protein